MQSYSPDDVSMKVRIYIDCSVVRGIIMRYFTSLKLLSMKSAEQSPTGKPKHLNVLYLLYTGWAIKICDL